MAVSEGQIGQLWVPFPVRSVASASVERRVGERYQEPFAPCGKSRLPSPTVAGRLYVYASARFGRLSSSAADGASGQGNEVAWWSGPHWCVPTVRGGSYWFAVAVPNASSSDRRSTRCSNRRPGPSSATKSPRARAMERTLSSADHERSSRT